MAAVLQDCIEKARNLRAFVEAVVEARSHVLVVCAGEPNGPLPDRPARDTIVVIRATRRRLVLRPRSHKMSGVNVNTTDETTGATALLLPAQVCAAAAVNTNAQTLRNPKPVAMDVRCVPVHDRVTKVSKEELRTKGWVGKPAHKHYKLLSLACFFIELASACKRCIARQAECALMPLDCSQLAAPNTSYSARIRPAHPHTSSQFPCLDTFQPEFGPRALPNPALPNPQMTPLSYAVLPDLETV